MTKVQLAVRGTGDSSISALTSAAEIGYTSLAEKLRDDERPKPEPEPDDGGEG